jgi:DNA gyrase subunit B
MYVGALDQAGVHHMLYWAFDDIVANVRAGRGHRLKVHIRKDDSIEIFDDGPPFPAGEGKPLERLDKMTSELLCGPERGLAPTHQIRSYLPILRALSERMEVTMYLGGQRYWRRYEKGVERGEEVWGAEYLNSEHREMLFSVKFWPDPEIFETTETDYKHVQNRLRQMAATCPEIEIATSHEIWSTRGRFTAIGMPNGMADLLKSVASEAGEHGMEPDEPFRLRVHSGDISFDVAIQWHWGHKVKDDSLILSWANTVKTSEGSHVLGLKEAVWSVGLDMVPYMATLSVFVPQPRFTTPTKGCLRNPEIRELVRDHLIPALRRLKNDDEFALRLDWMETRRGQESWKQTQEEE